ncbi:hypothetical protein C0J52_13065 [Blattella germanica]|nr:hypothetical protein C0J52_13065 [Blattella germanica]
MINSRPRSRSHLPSYERRTHRSSPVALSPSTSLPSPSHNERSRKRDHEPDEERKTKALKPSESDSPHENV